MIAPNFAGEVRLQPVRLAAMLTINFNVAKEWVRNMKKHILLHIPIPN